MVTGFVCVVNVVRLLGKTQPSVNMEEFILGQVSTSATNVGNPSTKSLSSFIPREVLLEKIVTCAVNVCSLLAIAPSLFNYR